MQSGPKHDTSFAVMLDEEVEWGNCNFLQLVCNMPYYGWCVRSPERRMVLLRFGKYGKWPRCSCGRLVVYNQQAREKSGRRTMAV